MHKLIVALSFVVAASAVAGAPLTKKKLEDGRGIVFAAYGTDKFDAVVKKLVAQLGAAKKVTPEMQSWFALDAANCLELAVSKNKEGFAAVTIVSNPDDPKSGCH